MEATVPYEKIILVLDVDVVIFQVFYVKHNVTALHLQFHPSLLSLSRKHFKPGWVTALDFIQKGSEYDPYFRKVKARYATAKAVIKYWKILERNVVYLICHVNYKKNSDLKNW